MIALVASRDPNPWNLGNLADGRTVVCCLQVVPDVAGTLHLVHCWIIALAGRRVANECLTDDVAADDHFGRFVCLLHNVLLPMPSNGGLVNVLLSFLVVGMATVRPSARSRL